MKLLPLIISLVVASIFLYSALTSSNAFNLIPISIHGAFLQDFVKENVFVQIFDIVFALALVRLTYNAVSRIMNV